MITVKEKKAESKLLENRITAKEERITLLQQIMRSVHQDEHMEELISSFPAIKAPYIQIRAQRGLYQMWLYNFKEAIEDYTWCINQEPCAELYSDRAVAYAALGKSAESKRDFKKMAEHTPSFTDRQRFAQCYASLADHAHEDGNYRLALTYYQAAIDVNPNEMYHNNHKRSLAALSAQKNKSETDKKTKNRLVKDNANESIEKYINKNIANLQLQLARLKYKIGDIEGAILSCTEAISLIPNDQEAIQARAWFQLRILNYKEAIADWTFLINQQSHSEPILEQPRRWFSFYNGRSLAHAVLGNARESKNDHFTAQKYESSLNPVQKLYFSTQYLEHADSENRPGNAAIFYREVLRLNPELAYKIKMPLSKDARTSFRYQSLLEVIIGFESLSDFNNHLQVNKVHRKNLYPLFQVRADERLKNEWKKVIQSGVLGKYTSEPSWDHLPELFTRDTPNYRRNISEFLISEKCFRLIDHLIKNNVHFEIDPIFFALCSDDEQAKESAAVTLQKLTAMGGIIKDKVIAIVAISGIFAQNPKKMTDHFLFAIVQLFFNVFKDELLGETDHSTALKGMIANYGATLSGIVKAAKTMKVEEMLIMKLQIHLLLWNLEKWSWDGQETAKIRQIQYYNVVHTYCTKALKRGERVRTKSEINSLLAQLEKFPRGKHDPIIHDLKKVRSSIVTDQALFETVHRGKLSLRTLEVDLLLSELIAFSKREKVKAIKEVASNIVTQLQGIKHIKDTSEDTLLYWEYAKSRILESARSLESPTLAARLQKLQDQGKILFRPLHEALWMLRLHAFAKNKEISPKPEVTLPGENHYLRFFFPPIQPKVAAIDKNSAYLIKQRELEIIFGAILQTLERQPENWGLDDPEIVLKLKSIVSMDEARNWFSEYWNWEKHQQLKAVFSEKMEKLESKTEVELAEKSEFLKKILEFLNAMDGFVASTTQKSDANIQLCTREAKNLPKVTPIPDEIDILPADAVSKPIEALRQLNQPGAFLARHARSPQTLRLFLFDPTQHDKPFRYNITLMANGHWHLWTPKDERSAYHIHYESRGEMETPAAKSRLASFVRAQLPILSRACGFNRSAPLFRSTETAESNADLKQNPPYPQQTPGAGGTYD